MAINVNRAGILILRLTIDGAALDISTATTKEITLDGVVKSAEFFTDGTDGRLRLALAAGDNPRSENHRAVGHVVLAGGAEYVSDDYYFWVAP